MCKSKRSTNVIEPTTTKITKPQASGSPPVRDPPPPWSSSVGEPPSSNAFSSNRTVSSDRGSSYASDSSSTSRAGIKASLPENPYIYEFSEISSATANFRNRFPPSPSSSSSSSAVAAWRCSLRGKEAIVFQRKFRRPVELKLRLSTICRSHHSSLIKLLGVSVSGSYIYLVYEFVQGANLADCLRNPRNPSFTILSTWLSRMQVATDLAHGLDYIHHCSGLRYNFVHNHIKSSSVVVAEVVSGADRPSVKAKICHFGTSELCGETEAEIEGEVTDSESSREIESEIIAAAAIRADGRSSTRSSMKKSRSRAVKVEGRRGYMAPEFQFTGIPTQKCDVYAFGVVILELLSGEEPLKYRVEEGGTDGGGGGGGYRRVSVIETARAAVEGGELRKWVDPRLKDSYPVEVAERMIQVGLDCVEEDPDKRPDMGRVAVLVSKLFLESTNWAKKIGIPTDFSVSLAPR
ncbi:Tyrosine-protein kinase [Trema orientale]|uniref:Tyrosine-protein kinase n=1 Tax=Trema orientale TaxID=63057 RepID=A0A2P5D3X1_TREOI|nr:Tyrosine-protein kinase [Trema orientale]